MRNLATVAVALLLAACGSEAAGSDPSPGGGGAATAVERFVTALEAGDCEAVKRDVVTPDAIDCEQVEQLRGSYAEAGTDLDTMSLRVGEVVGSSSSVTISWASGEPDETWNVEKVDGSWRVVFDSQE